MRRCIWGCRVLNDDLKLIWKTCPVILLELLHFGNFKNKSSQRFCIETHIQNFKYHLYPLLYICLKNCLVGSSHQKTNVGSISSFPEYKWRQFVQFICLFLNPEVSPHSGALKEISSGCSKLGVFINCFYVAAPMEIKIQPKGFVLSFGIRIIVSHLVRAGPGPSLCGVFSPGSDLC